MKITIKSVNRAVGDLGVKLVKGKGYFYFEGAPVERAYSASVMVHNLGQLNVRQWRAEAVRIIAEAKEGK